MGLGSFCLLHIRINQGEYLHLNYQMCRPLTFKNIITQPAYLRLLLSCLIVCVMVGTACQSPKKTSEDRAQVMLPAPALKRMSYEQYGLDVSQNQVIQDRLGEDQYMQDILLTYGVPRQLIDTVAARSPKVFDVRYMRAGNPFTVVMGPKKQVQYFIYEKSEADFVVFDLRDSVEIYEGRKQVIARENGGAWFINTSLFEAIAAQGLDVRLASLLEEIFAWSVDFSYLDDSDFFKVIYEEEFVDEVSIGISRIVAAQFHHRGTDHFAFAYQPDDTTQLYLDQLGRNVQRTFFLSPLKYTSALGPDSSLDIMPAKGLEYTATSGTPVIAVGDGTLTDIKRVRKSVNLRIQHGRGYASEYLGLGASVDSLQPGMQIAQGQVIGFVGGKQEGAMHQVRFRFLNFGNPLSLHQLEQGQSLTLPDRDRISFAKQVKRWQRRLARINPVPAGQTAYLN